MSASVAAAFSTLGVAGCIGIALLWAVSVLIVLADHYRKP